MVRDARTWVGERVVSWGPLSGDAFLYALSALFAAGTAIFSTLSLYRVWGELAVGPYAAGAVASALLARHRHRSEARGSPSAGKKRRRPGARVWILVVVLVGATVVPLSVEVVLRSQGDASLHVQPEVVTIQQAADRLAHGEDPYHAVVDHGHVVSAVPGEPSYESFFPYLPLMALFGLPGSTHAPVRLTDARIFISAVTLLVVAAALALCRAPRNSRFRALQFLVVLPTAALPLATGGDDMPIVAFLLLAMVLAQRRRPALSGVVLGIVSAMKFTAWPLALLALFAARGRDGRRAPGRMALGMLLVAGPVVVPFVLGNPRAFFVNVVLFPLGLAGVASPAASALPGHVLVSLFPSLHRILPLTVAAVGGLVLVRHLVRHPPSTAGQVTNLAGWIMLVAILFAPATRVGYLLYPVDFFVIAWMLNTAEKDGRTTPAVEDSGANSGLEAERLTSTGAALGDVSSRPTLGTTGA
jgi:Glycosyltransferase family 87